MSQKCLTRLLISHRNQNISKNTSLEEVLKQFTSRTVVGKYVFGKILN